MESVYSIYAILSNQLLYVSVTMESLEKLTALVEKSQILNGEMFAGIDLDSILDVRDTEPFDSRWITAYKEVEAVWKDSKPSLEEVEYLRKLVFVTVSNLTKHHEISSYVSDDFELIGKSIPLGHENELIKLMHDNYVSGKLPQL